MKNWTAPAVKPAGHEALLPVAVSMQWPEFVRRRRLRPGGAVADRHGRVAAGACAVSEAAAGPVLPEIDPVVGRSRNRVVDADLEVPTVANRQRLAHGRRRLSQVAGR